MKSKVIILFLFFLGSQGFSQSKALQKLFDNPKKLEKSCKFEYGVKPYKKYEIRKGNATQEDYKLPKRIGLITYFVSDMENTKTYSDGVTATSWRTKESIDWMANNLYQKTIEKMKESFSSRGMRLLDVQEYLDTPEKKSRYANFKVKKLRLIKALDKFSKEGNVATAKGYRSMTLPQLGLFSLGAVQKRDKFFEDLELDAVLIITITLNTMQEESFQEIKADLLYKNPFQTEKKLHVFRNYQHIYGTVGSHYHAKRPTHRNILIFGEREYTNKRGKVKTEETITGFDPNFYKLINHIVDGVVLKTIDYVENY